MVAWVWTILFVPAYIMLISEKSLANFGAASKHAGADAAKREKKSWLTRLLSATGQFTFNKAKAILVVILIVTGVAVYGITRIQINDNPVKWFSKSHPIRVADIELNRHFGGTYMAYLVLDSADPGEVNEKYVKQLLGRLEVKCQELKEMPGSDKVSIAARDLVNQQAGARKSKDELLMALSQMVEAKAGDTGNSEADVWYELVNFFDLEKESLKIFKRPEVLEYIVKLQQHLGVAKSGEGRKLVGKTNSIADVVKKVYQELIDGRVENAIIPDTSPKVAQTLLQYQSSHKPDDLWHLVTSDYMHANVWCQLTSGDNKDMEAVVASLEQYMKDNPPPVPLKHNWAGLTYINTVWQDKMVSGMLQSFMGSFLVVFIMMSILFRSPLWGIVCMVPLTVTIALIYGVIGLVGKDYDMPVAVLSSLTLGMAVDFAIHFLERARDSCQKSGSWKASVEEMFGEPARAISLNVVVIAVGFLPLLAAPLMPYKTVGVFLCAIMSLSGAITLLVLPAILRLGEKLLFKPAEKRLKPSCVCGGCFVISIAAVLLIVISVNQYVVASWSELVWVGVIAVPVLGLVCSVVSRRKACKDTGGKEKTD
jgi:predicted RND superfamily exporter protein